MRNKDIEIEIQVQVEKVEPLLSLLEKEAEFQEEEHQVDEYFTPAHRDFLEGRPTKEWLRVRESGKKYSLNYKNWHYDKEGKSQFCDEYETAVDDVEQLKKVLQALNFTSLVIVDKLRKTWKYKDYEVAVDSVKELGDFVEIEYIGKDEKVDPKKITDEMVSFLRELGCGKIERNYVGYPFQLLFPDETTVEE